MADTSSQRELVAGFADPVLESQKTFRALLAAMSRPGVVLALAGLPQVPTPLSPAAAALALTLLDLNTPVWLDQALDREPVRAFLRFHCGCPLVPEPGRARFALIGRPMEMPDLGRFNPGTPEYPDRSATLIIQVEALAEVASPAEGKILTGPGIKDRAFLGVSGLPPVFWPAWAANHQGFPLGVDVILCAPDNVAGLPRSVQVEG